MVPSLLLPWLRSSTHLISWYCAFDALFAMICYARGMDELQTFDYTHLCESEAFRTFTSIVAALFGMSVALYPPDQSHGHFYATPSPHNEICAAIRATPVGLAACRASESERFAQVRATRSNVCCPCHAGFIDVAVPIVYQDTLIAIISSGQLLLEPHSEAGFQRYRALHAQFNIPLSQLQSAYARCPYLDAEKIDAVVTLMAFFAEHLCETAQQFAALRRERAPDYVAQALRYIDAHCDEALTLPLVARRVGVSPSHLSRRFSRTTRMSFTEYVQRVRIDHAKRYLSQTETPITTAAFRSGFNCLSQFNRTFRKLEGCTPHAYRQRYRPLT